ncbi:hypothetical protein BGZ82_000786 [Podila clonocystis]|nr:hypothetical protein BGZ82_000786 [Podila clonocystis]
MGPKRPSKGVPIDVPTTHRRLSNFSEASTNSALMTGIRDGGPSSRRRPSAGHTSPPNHYSKGNDFTIIGTVAGYGSENNSTKHQNKRPKPDVVLLSDDESKGHISKKARERTSAEVLSKVSPQPGSVVSRMKKSSDPHAIARTNPILSHTDVADVRPSISNYSSKPSLLPKISAAASSAASTIMSRMESAFSKSTPTTHSPSSHLSLSPSSPQGRRIGTVVSHDPLCSPSKTQALGMGTFPRATLTKVRVGKQEFMDPEMAVQFGPDRIIIDIGMSVTKIPHAEIKIVEFFITDENPIKLLQINTSGRLPETSNLAPFYDPTPNSSGARKITLYSNSASTIFLDFCSKLKKSDRIRVTTMTLFVYPFKSSAKSKSIAVRQQDVGRLDDDEFLNDTIIELGLKYVHTTIECSNKIRATKTYIFNSFFYERLISGSSKESIISYDAVKSWTNKVDLFSMKYIIVPIHESMHCTMILVMDSLGGQHSSVFKTLRAYLQQELLTRKNITKTLGPKEVLARYATKAPKQENFCDCGLYLLHYAEMFLKYPKQLSDSIVNKTDGTTFWELSRLPKKRQDYRDLVAELMVQYKVYQEQMAAVKP